MPTFNKYAIVTLFALLLSACESAPKPELQAQAEAAPETLESPLESEATATAETSPDEQVVADEAPISPFADPQPVAEPEPVDRRLIGKLVETAADKPQLFTNIGLAHFRLQQDEPAEQAFLRALELDSADAVAWNHLGILHRRAGRFQEALAAYQNAIQIDEKYAHAQLNLGILFDLYLQDLEKALAQYRKYQSLVTEENSQVAGWIVDIERRLKTNNTQTQG